MNNPSFSQAFSSTNPDITSKIDALKNTNQSIMSKDNLLSNIDSIKDFIESIQAALKATLSELLNSGKINAKELIDNIKNAIQNQINNSTTNNPEADSLLKIYNNNLSDKEKLEVMLKKDKLSSIESNELNNALKGVDNKNLVDGFSKALVNNPPLNESFNSMMDSKKINLTSDEMKNNLIKVLSESKNDSALSILKSLLKEDAIDPTLSGKLNDSIINDTKNKNNSNITNIQNQNVDNVEKLKQLSNINPTLNSECVSSLQNLIQTLNDQQMKDVYNKALSDPSFVNALNSIKQADSKTGELMNTLNNLNLSPSEMKDLLVNSNNKDLEFASSSNKISSKYEDPKSLETKTKGILNDISNSDKIKNKDELLNGLNKLNDNVKIQYDIDKNKDLLNILKDKIPNYANNSIKKLSDESIKNAFKEITNDPALLQALLQANPNLLNTLQSMIKNKGVNIDINAQKNKLMKDIVDNAQTSQDLYQEKTLTGINNEQLEREISKVQNELQHKINSIISLKLKEKSTELYNKFKE